MILVNVESYVNFIFLYFPITKIKSRSPLEILHTDLWGLASVFSMDVYRYYISFVNDYIGYD